MMKPLPTVLILSLILSSCDTAKPRQTNHVLG